MEILFAPMHTNSPMPSGPGAVWLTITVPKAPNGHGDTSCDKAALACRIQCARVLKGILLIASVGLLMVVCCANTPAIPQSEISRNPSSGAKSFMVSRSYLLVAGVRHSGMLIQ